MATTFTVSPAEIEQFEDELFEHVWSWSPRCQSYKDFTLALRAEQRFTDRAAKMGFRAVQALQIAQAQERSRIAATVRDESAAVWREHLETVKAKYATPLQLFEERLTRHDWHYDYSDDNRVWRAGRDAEEALQKEATAAGGEILRAWQTAARAHGRQL